MASERFWDEPIETGPFLILVLSSIVSSLVADRVACCCSYLAMEGKKVLLIEKGVWPRDKICGDAVGGKSLGHVQALRRQGYLESTPHFRTGIVFSSPNGSEVTVPLPEEDVEKMEAGYLSATTIRLASIPQSNRIGSRKWGSVIQGATVTQVFDNDGKISGVRLELEEEG